MSDGQQTVPVLCHVLSFVIGKLNTIEIRPQLNREPISFNQQHSVRSSALKNLLITHFSLATTHLLKFCVHLIIDVTAIHPFQGDICARNGSLHKMSLPSATNNKTKAREYELETECSSTAHRNKLARDTGEVRNGARVSGASLSLRGPGSILGQSKWDLWWAKCH